MKKRVGLVVGSSPRQKSTYDQAVRSLGLSLDRLHDLYDIARLIVVTVVETLRLNGGCLAVMDSDGSPEIVATLGSLVSDDARSGFLSQLDPATRNPRTEFPRLLPENSGAACIVPLVLNGKEIGVLGITSKISQNRFSPADCFLIRQAAVVSADAVQRALLFRKANIRDTFLSVASHEINSPLTSIIGYSELLLRRNISDSKEKRWLQQIYESGKQMSAVVSSLLDVTRIRKSDLGFKIEPVNFSEALENPLVLARETSPQHRFEVSVTPGLPALLVDRDKYSHIIWQLLSNAVKFSAPGSQIWLATCYQASDNQVILSVRDEGIGIAPDDCASLFKTFHRIRRPETTGVRGSGLGLYIVKSWTEAMGGRVWLESELNNGSTFYVAVPALSRDFSGA